MYAKYWYWFLISIIFCCGCAYFYSKKHPKKNEVVSSILVTQDDGTAAMLNGLGGLLGADPYVQDEIFVITSHSVLKKVVKDLGTNKIHIVKTGFLTNKFEYPTFPVDVYADPALMDTLSHGIKFEVEVLKGASTANIEASDIDGKLIELSKVELPATVSTKYGDFIVSKTDTYPGDEELETTITLSGYDGAAESLDEDLQTEIASKKSNVINLAILTTNATYGRDVLNKIMEVYNERGIEERNQRASKTAAFIAERLDLISTALDQAEGQIEEYKEGHRLIDVQTEAAINTSLKTQYESRLIELETQKEILLMTLKFLSSPENQYELMPVTALELSSGDSAVDTYNELVLKRMTMMSGAKSTNKQIREIEKQIDALRANILVAIDQTINALNVSINDARAQANLAMSKLGNVPTQEREFVNLKRQQEVKQQLYLFLLQRSEETAMLIANAIPKGTIIDEAYVLRDPVGPGKKTFIVIAFIIGIFLPVFFIYLRNLLRSRINGVSDVEKITGLPILGEMCIDKSGNSIVVADDSTSPSSELFRMIRTNLQFVLGNIGDKVVLVTSSLSGEGKSFVSSNLAVSLALLNRKVVLVGMDIRKPQLATYLGIPSSPGLTQYLSNSQVKLDEIIKPYESVPGLSTIVAGPIPPNPGELMTSPRIAELISDLRERFDYIILDTAPVGMVSDSFNLTKYTDATIFVVREKATRMQDLRFLNEIAEDERLKRVSVVINGTSTKKGYGYGYR